MLHTFPGINPFQSTHPLRGATGDKGRHCCIAGHFNPRTPCGVRHPSADAFIATVKFQSTHPLRGATRQRLIRSQSRLFQSTHPLRGATWDEQTVKRLIVISIHAPLAGCDCQQRQCRPDTPHFNPRTPCGVRRKRHCDFHACFKFQSTHPLRGATRIARNTAIAPKYFNPRTPCGVRLRQTTSMMRRSYFNPRTPCGVRPMHPNTGRS